jgi:PAS domain-containing protein
VATDAQDVFFESRYTQLLQNEELRLALWVRLLLATATFAVALAIRFAVLPSGYGSAYFTFYPAVLAAAVFLGGGPALLVVALSAIAGDLFFLPPYRSDAVDLRVLAPALAFTLSGGAICWLAHVTRGSVRTLKSERQNLQVEKQKLLRLQEALPAGVVLTDMSGRFVEFNSAFVRLTGYTPEELRQLDDRALGPPLCAGEPACQSALATHGRCGPVERDYAPQGRQHHTRSGHRNRLRANARAALHLVSRRGHHGAATRTGRFRAAAARAEGDSRQSGGRHREDQGPNDRVGE